MEIVYTDQMRLILTIFLIPYTLFATTVKVELVRVSDPSGETLSKIIECSDTQCSILQKDHKDIEACRGQFRVSSESLLQVNRVLAKVLDHPHHWLLAIRYTRNNQEYLHFVNEKNSKRYEMILDWEGEVSSSCISEDMKR